MSTILSCDSDSSSSDVSYSFYITEVSTSGSVGGLTIDYIELYNSTTEDIDLTGYYFGDSEGIDDCHVITSTVSVNTWNSLTETEGVTTGAWESVTTEDTGNAAIIPAGGYLIILFTNDLKIDDAVSKTTLPTSWNEFDKDENDDGTYTVTITDTYTVDADFIDETYLTIPEGLKGSKSEGVYIYKADGTQATTFFTYDADEQEDDKVFLSGDGSIWSQGNSSPGSANQ